MPTTAIGSRRARSARSSRACSSTASSASRLRRTARRSGRGSRSSRPSCPERARRAAARPPRRTAARSRSSAVVRRRSRRRRPSAGGSGSRSSTSPRQVGRRAPRPSGSRTRASPAAPRRARAPARARLRSSTAISESRPSSLQRLARVQRAVAASRPSTRATRAATWLTSSRRCRARAVARREPLAQAPRSAGAARRRAPSGRACELRETASGAGRRDAPRNARPVDRHARRPAGVPASMQPARAPPGPRRASWPRCPAAAIRPLDAPRSAAAPTSAHAPQLMLSAGKARARRRCAQRVEEGVGRGVVGLARRAEQRRRPTRRGRRSRAASPRVSACEVPGAVDLGRQHGREARPVLLQQHAVVEHAGRVDDAAQRRQPVARASASDTLDVRRGRDVRRARPSPARRRLRSAAIAAGAVVGPAPRRPISTRWRAPRSTSQRGRPRGRARRARR